VIRYYNAKNDEKSKKDVMNSIALNSVIIVLTGLAIAISGIIQATTYGLSTYHTVLLLALCWVIIIGALTPYLVMWYDTESFSGRSPFASMLKGFHPLTNIIETLALFHSVHFTVTCCVGLWFYSSVSTFDRSPDGCTASTVMVIVGHKHLVTDHAIRNFFIALYSIFLVPLLNIFIIELVFVVLPLILPLSVIFLMLIPKFIRFVFKLLCVIVICLILPCCAGWEEEDDMDYTLLDDFQSLGPAVVLPGPLIAIILIIVSTEQTIRANNVTPGEGQWTLGQTLALMAAVISTLEFDLWVYRQIFPKRKNEGPCECIRANV
jgi:hypothetical protein